MRHGQKNIKLHNRKVTSSPNQDVWPAKAYSGLSKNLFECFRTEAYISKTCPGQSCITLLWRSL